AATLADAQKLLESGKLDEAERAFQALVPGADDADALHGLGLVKFQRGDNAGALRLLEAANAMRPDRRFAHNAAVALHRQGRTAEAVERERRNIAAHADYVPSYFSLAEMLDTTGDREGAAGILIQLCRLAANTPDTRIVAQTVAKLIALDVPHRDL